MITTDEITSIGKFHKTHALKGELNAMLDIDAEFLDTEHPLIMDIDGIFVPFYCETVRPKSHFSSLVKLQGVDSEEEARKFVNKQIFALKKDVVEFDDETEDDAEGGYAEDFIGYKIIDETSGTAIGIIDNVNLSTANPLFEVDANGEMVYIPIADEFITEINDETKTISMDLPDGLVDLNT